MLLLTDKNKYFRRLCFFGSSYNFLYFLYFRGAVHGKSEVSAAKFERRMSGNSKAKAFFKAAAKRRQK